MDSEIMRRVRNDWGGKGTTGKFKFHHICGENIHINKPRNAAYREAGFSHGLCFSHCPLLPGQLFLIEISDAQDGWSGHLRIGVTQHDPSELHTVPEMVIPDMTTGGSSTEERQITKGGQTWATAVTKFHNRISGRHKEIVGEPCDSGNKERIKNIASFANQRISVKSLYFLARKELTFTSSGNRFPDFGQSVFIGSRIGVTLVPVNSDTGAELASDEERICISEKTDYSLCNMHLIINGEDQGPCATLIPLDRPLYVVIDVYSITKQVKIVDTPYIGTLADLARDKIRSQIKSGQRCEHLPIPTSIKKFCQYQ
ncbi:neuralized-like protein 2 [Styela clava]